MLILRARNPCPLLPPWSFSQSRRPSHRQVCTSATAEKQTVSFFALSPLSLVHSFVGFSSSPVRCRGLFFRFFSIIVVLYFCSCLSFFSEEIMYQVIFLFDKRGQFSQPEPAVKKCRNLCTSNNRKKIVCRLCFLSLHVFLFFCKSLFLFPFVSFMHFCLPDKDKNRTYRSFWGISCWQMSDDLFFSNLNYNVLNVHLYSTCT